MLIVRYLSSELFKTTLAVLLFLFLVVLSNRLVLVLADASAGEFGREAIWMILALQIPKFLSLLIPVGFAFAVLLTLNRLGSHNEIDSIYGSGFSEQQMLKRLWVLSAFISLFTALFSLWLSPKSVSYQEKLKVEHAHTISKSLISPGRFQQVLGRSDWVVYVEDLSQNESTLHRILLLKATSKKDNSTEVLMAEKGFFSKGEEEENRYLTLENGVRYEGTPGTYHFKLTQFETLMIPMKLEVRTRSSKRSAKQTLLLLQSVRPEDKSELYWRLSLPITAPIMMLFMIPLARVSHREARIGKVFIAILLILLYYNFLTVSRSWVEQHMFSMWRMLGLTHGIFLCIGLSLLINPLQWKAWKDRIPPFVKGG